jgi:hypothetical protein
MNDHSGEELDLVMWIKLINSKVNFMVHKVLN